MFERANDSEVDKAVNVDEKSVLAPEEMSLE